MIPASTSRYELRIPLTDDTIPESSETFALTLQASTTGHVRDGATTVTIRENDGYTPTVTTAAPGGDGGNGDGKMRMGNR